MQRPGFNAYDPATGKPVGESSVQAMWGVGSDLFELTGYDNIVYSNMNSSSWTLDYRSTTSLNAIWGTTLEHVYVVGNGGLILRRD